MILKNNMSPVQKVYEAELIKNVETARNLEEGWRAKGLLADFYEDIGQSDLADLYRWLVANKKKAAYNHYDDGYWDWFNLLHPKASTTDELDEDLFFEVRTRFIQKGVESIAQDRTCWYRTEHEANLALRGLVRP